MDLLSESDPYVGIRILDRTVWRFTKEMESNQPNWDETIDFSDYDLPQTVGT